MRLLWSAHGSVEEVASPERSSSWQETAGDVHGTLSQGETVTSTLEVPASCVRSALVSFKSMARCPPRLEAQSVSDKGGEPCFDGAVQ